MSQALRRIIVCALCCALLTGCSALPQGPSDTTTPTQDTSIGEFVPVGDTKPVLAYCASDTLHPYRATSRVNRQLLPLLYEGLVAVDAAWDAKPALAAKWQRTDATHIVATLRENAVFSDGTAVTPRDVVTSFAAAKQCAYYTAVLQNIQTVQASGDRTVTVTLEAADPLAANALVFPVIREQGDSVYGTGAYRQEGAALCAVGSAAITRWALTDVSRADEMAYALSSGAVAYYFADAETQGSPVPSGTVGQVAVTQNTLVFLGIQAHAAPFDTPAVRAALSGAISRRALCADVFSGSAVPAVTPFIPTWSGAASLTGFSETENVAITVAKWQELGYNKRDAELLVCADRPLHTALASALTTQCAAAGLTLTVVSLPTEEYRARIQKGNYTLYLGEIALTADLSLRPLLQKGGAAASGVSDSGAALYARYLAGELSAAEFVTAFAADAPFLPLCWRQGIGYYRADVRGVAPYGTNAYGGISLWTMK